MPKEVRAARWCASSLRRDTSAVVAQALKKHATVDQLKAEKILAPWQRYSGACVSTDAFIESLYYALTSVGH